MFKVKKCFDNKLSETFKSSDYILLNISQFKV